jgi:hypothetical protein
MASGKLLFLSNFADTFFLSKFVDFLKETGKEFRIAKTEKSVEVGITDEKAIVFRA